MRALPFEGDDEALLAGLKRRHPPAIAALCDRYGDHVKRVLVRILGYDQELADVHHDVFVRALEGLHTLSHARSLRGWLTVIAINRAKTVLRRRSRWRWLGLGPAAAEAPTDVPAPQRDDAAAEALERTYQLLARMPADERVPFTLRFIDDMELVDLAEACEVSLATVKRRLARAQKRFRALAHQDAVLRQWLEEGDRWS